MYLGGAGEEASAVGWSQQRIVCVRAPCGPEPTYTTMPVRPRPLTALLLPYGKNTCRTAEGALYPCNQPPPEPTGESPLSAALGVEEKLNRAGVKNTGLLAIAAVAVGAAWIWKRRRR